MVNRAKVTQLYKDDGKGSIVPWQMFRRQAHESGDDCLVHDRREKSSRLFQLRPYCLLMSDLTFERLCKLLATTHGGYTVWLGAGAGAALTHGKCPSWSVLVETLAGERDKPQNWMALDYPARLDWIAGVMGHASFRKALRGAIIDPMISADLNKDVAAHMGLIGTRAGTVVSFNIDTVSAVPIAAALGGSFVPRAYRSTGYGESPTGFQQFTNGGIVCKPVYFPHGVLDTSGDCVITESEYLSHSMSLAVTTAINQCLGGDLLILGMSLGDRYLREALVRHRHSIREIFWVTNSTEHGSWARGARVHKIPAKHEAIWSGIANSSLEHDNNGELRKLYEGEKGIAARCVRGIESIRKFLAGFEKHIIGMADELLRPEQSASNFVRFVRHCEDLGFDVPQRVLEDDRFAAGWTTGRDPDSQSTIYAGATKP